MVNINIIPYIWTVYPPQMQTFDTQIHPCF